jgi:hypothetical protein
MEETGDLQFHCMHMPCCKQLLCEIGRSCLFLPFLVHYTEPGSMHACQQAQLCQSLPSKLAMGVKSILA